MRNPFCAQLNLLRTPPQSNRRGHWMEEPVIDNDPHPTPDDPIELTCTRTSLSVIPTGRPLTTCLKSDFCTAVPDRCPTDVGPEPQQTADRPVAAVDERQPPSASRQPLSAAHNAGYTTVPPENRSTRILSYAQRSAVLVNSPVRVPRTGRLFVTLEQKLHYINSGGWVLTAANWCRSLPAVGGNCTTIGRQQPAGEAVLKACA